MLTSNLELSRQHWLDDSVRLATEIERVVSFVREFSDRELQASILSPAGARIVSDRVFGSFHEVATDIDDRSDDFLLPALRHTLPGSFTEESLRRESEEITSRRFAAPAVWVADPLDGTSELLQGLPTGCSILLALLVRGADSTFSSRCGIVHLPVAKQTWYADALGNVNFRTPDETRRIAPAQKFDGPVRCYVRQVDRRPALERFYSIVGTHLGLQTEIVPTGGAGAGFAQLFQDAEQGRRGVLCYNVDYTKEWDVSAGDAILTSLSGSVRDLEGKPFKYNRRDPFNRKGFIACIGVSIDDLLACLPDGLLERTLTEPSLP